MKLFKKLLDNYYTEVLIKYIKEVIKSRYYIKIITVEEKNRVGVFFNYCESSKELKHDIHVFTLDKEQSLIILTTKLDIVIENIKKEIERRDSK